MNLPSLGIPKVLHSTCDLAPCLNREKGIEYICQTIHQFPVGPDGKWVPSCATSYKNRSAASLNYITGCFTEKYLHSLPKLKNDTQDHLDLGPQRLRWLFYTGASWILGWREQWVFSKILPDFVHEVMYPFPKIEREEWPTCVSLTIPRYPPIYVDSRPWVATTTKSIRKGYASRNWRRCWLSRRLHWWRFIREAPVVGSGAFKK